MAGRGAASTMRVRDAGMGPRFNTGRPLEPLGYLPPAEYEMRIEWLTLAPMLLEHFTT
jgi:hypothetical protein